MNTYPSFFVLIESRNPLGLISNATPLAPLSGPLMKISFKLSGYVFLSDSSDSMKDFLDMSSISTSCIDYCFKYAVLVLSCKNSNRNKLT